MLNDDKKYFALILTLFFVSACGLTAHAAALPPISHSLRLGMTSQDVLSLQKILNSDPRTQISSSGIGSPGQETTYFGHLTQQAVIKFQNIYAADILTPAGLSSGNGFVGPLTIKKLNSLSEVAVTSYSQVTPPLGLPQNNQNTQQQSHISTSTPRLFSISPYQVKPGGTLTINGANFSASNNAITLGTYTFSNLTSTANAQISIQIPPDLLPGTYNLSLTSNGVAAKAPLGNSIPVVVSLSPLPLPTITSITPEKATQTDTITIKGTGFSQKTSIFTPLGYVRDLVSPDGTTLTFTPSQLSQISKATIIEKNAAATSQTVVGLYIPVVVVTDGGVSQSPRAFILTQ